MCESVSKPLKHYVSTMSPSKTDLGPGTSKQMVLLTTTEGSHQGILPMDINGHGTLKVHNGSFRCPVDVGLHTS
jgi:hypothetical protein